VSLHVSGIEHNRRGLQHNRFGYDSFPSVRQLNFNCLKRADANYRWTVEFGCMEEICPTLHVTAHA
jgi:hypothetical protein